MRSALWTLAALASHWRRRPGQLAAMIAGLAAATALWSGVQALNAQARAAYDRAADTLAGQDALIAADGETIPQALYLDLRRAGWLVSPVVEGQVRIGGAALRVLGVEPVTLARLGDTAFAQGAPDNGDGAGMAALLTPPGRALIAPETAAALGLRDGDLALTDEGAQLPPIALAPGAEPGAATMDIGAAQGLLGMDEQITRLVVTGPPSLTAPPLEAASGGALRPAPDAGAGDLQDLSGSFRLNLTAFALLAFLVGLFIVYSAAGLAFEQRRGAMRTMRAVGVSARALAAALLAETVLLALGAGALGLVCGYAIAAALLPDVAASLRGLYGAPVSGELSLQAGWWLGGLGMSLAGALTALGAGLVRAARMPVLAPAQPIAWRTVQQRWLAAQAALAAALLLAFAGFWALGGLAAGFAAMACLLLGGALALPPALALALRLAQNAAGRSGGEGGGGAMAEWFWADARREMSGLSLALMALLLALAANIGVGAMVGGFRGAFVGWLDQRLAADVYVNFADPADAADAQAWLAARGDVDAALLTAAEETAMDGFPVEAEGFTDDALYRRAWPLLDGPMDGAAWDAVAAGETALVSEQLARRIGLTRGGAFTLPTPEGGWPLRVAGIYPDYGNPRGQVRVGLAPFLERWPAAAPSQIELRAAPGAEEAIMTALRERYGPAAAQMMAQDAVKALSLRIFERTFAVTAALNVLTLLVAGAALLATLAALAGQRLPQLAPVWAAGAPRRTLARLELGKTLALAGLTAVLAIPLGVAVTWLLVAVINVEAFGWRLPLRLFPLDWLRLIALALAAALAAAALPAWKLARTRPAQLARVFADER